MTIEIFDSHLCVNGLRYFRGNASAISLGDFGRKKQPAFGINYLEVHQNGGLAEVDLSARMELGLTQEILHRAIGNFSITLAGQGASTSGARLKQESWDLALVHFAMNLEDVHRNIADEEQFERLGKQARVVFQIWVIVEATHARTIAAAGNLKATAERGRVVVRGNLDAKKSSEQLVTLSEGSTFAYLLARRKRNGRFTTDQHGPS